MNKKYLRILTALTTISLIGYICFLLFPESAVFESSDPLSKRITLVLFVSGIPLVLVAISMAFDVFKAWGGLYCLGYVACFRIFGEIEPMLIYLGLYGLIWKFYSILQNKT